MFDPDIESQLSKKYNIIAGIDEAGRGALAGPVFAASVIYNNLKKFPIGLNDSKLLSHSKRKELFDYISAEFDYGIGKRDNSFIDEKNILNATFESMHDSISNLNIKPVFLAIDGNMFRDMGIKYQTYIKGDSRLACIAAASIIAKVSRDKWMSEVAESFYPEYGFAKHKGYGTKFHIDMIRKHGPSPLHRKTFLKKLLLCDVPMF